MGRPKPGMRSRNATLVGLVAVLLWSAIVGLIRSVSESFGATGGAASGSKPITITRSAPSSTAGLIGLLRRVAPST